MLTLFTIPPESKAEKIQISRTNALTSWLRLNPACEIILFGGGDELASLAAARPQIRHVPDVARSNLGTPLLGDAFQRAQVMARGDVLMFSNCDMLYFDDLQSTIGQVTFPIYMLCGRRWDLEVPGLVAPEDHTGWSRLRSRYANDGKMHGPGGLDFFIFPRSLHIEIPPFVVGRPGWDSWLMWRMRSLGVPVIDATGAITALHQNHDYSHLKHGAKQYTGSEMQANYHLAGGYRNMLGLRESNWVFSDGVLRRPAWPLRIFSLLAPTWPYRFALAGKRHLQRKIAAVLAAK